MKILDDHCHFHHSTDFLFFPWWNISNSVNIRLWVSFLGILGMLNPNSSSDYSFCWPRGHGGHGRSWPPWWNISNSVNIGCWVSFLCILGVLNPISSSDYSFCWPRGHGSHGRSWLPWWNISNSVNIGCWVSF